MIQPRRGQRRPAQDPPKSEPYDRGDGDLERRSGHDRYLYEGRPRELGFGVLQSAGDSCDSRPDGRRMPHGKTWAGVGALREGGEAALHREGRRAAVSIEKRVSHLARTPGLSSPWHRIIEGAVMELPCRGVPVVSYATCSRQSPKTGGSGGIHSRDVCNTV